MFAIALDIVATGVNSQIKLDSLEDYSDLYGEDFGEALFSTLAARSGGSVLIPKLKQLRGVNLEIDAESSIATTQFERITHGNVTLSGADRPFANLTDASDTDFTLSQGHFNFPELTTLSHGSFTINDAGTVLSPKLANVNGASLRVKSGTVLSLPEVKSFSHAATGNGEYRYLEADGVGSRLELPQLEHIAGADQYNGRIYITAANGGVIDLAHVRQIADAADGDTRYRLIDVVAVVQEVESNSTIFSTTPIRTESILARGYFPPSLHKTEVPLRRQTSATRMELTSNWTEPGARYRSA